MREMKTETSSVSTRLRAATLLIFSWAGLFATEWCCWPAFESNAVFVGTVLRIATFTGIGALAGVVDHVWQSTDRRELVRGAGAGCAAWIAGGIVRYAPVLLWPTMPIPLAWRINEHGAFSGSVFSGLQLVSGGVMGAVLAWLQSQTPTGDDWRGPAWLLWSICACAIAWAFVPVAIMAY